MSELLIRNAGTIVSGDVAAPIAAGDTVVMREGMIAFVGDGSDADASGISAVIDAAGATVTPGLCDDHTHPVMGDFTPAGSVGRPGVCGSPAEIIVVVPPCR